MLPYNKFNKPTPGEDKKITRAGLVKTVGAVVATALVADQVGKLARPLKMVDGITSLAATETDTKLYPNSPIYKNWTQEQRLAFKRSVMRDRWQFGRNGWNKRKWWYETVYDLSLRPQKYSLSCEFNCLHKLLKFNGINTLRDGSKITEDALINATPVNVNPNLGRPANINGNVGKIPPDNYGTYAKALAGSVLPKITGATLQGFNSADFNPSNGPIQEQYKNLFLSLANKGPFIFWFQQNPSLGTSTFYDPELNKNVLVGPTEHCGICLAVDYDNKKIMYADPLNNGLYYMDIEGEDGLIARAQNVDFNMLSLQHNY